MQEPTYTDIQKKNIEGFVKAITTYHDATLAIQEAFADLQTDDTPAEFHSSSSNMGFSHTHIKAMRMAQSVQTIWDGLTFPQDPQCVIFKQGLRDFANFAHQFKDPIVGQLFNAPLHSTLAFMAMVPEFPLSEDETEYLAYRIYEPHLNPNPRMREIGLQEARLLLARQDHAEIAQETEGFKKRNERTLPQGAGLPKFLNQPQTGVVERLPLAAGTIGLYAMAGQHTIAENVDAIAAHFHRQTDLQPSQVAFAGTALVTMAAARLLWTAAIRPRVNHWRHRDDNTDRTI